MVEHPVESRTRTAELPPVMVRKLNAVLVEIAADGCPVQDHR